MMLVQCRKQALLYTALPCCCCVGTFNTMLRTVAWNALAYVSAAPV